MLSEIIFSETGACDVKYVFPQNVKWTHRTNAYFSLIIQAQICKLFDNADHSAWQISEQGISVM